MARELARKGNHVIMLCRNLNKAAAARERILKASQHKNVDILLGDLSSQHQIREVAAQFNDQYPRLDVLINNAGVLMGKQRKESTDGLEMTFAVNHLGPFLLTGQLLESLKESDYARIVNVASEAHRYANLDFNNLQLKEHYSGFRAYCNSKLCNILFTRELHQRLKGIPITVNAFHPGTVGSNFGRYAGGVYKWFFQLAKPLLLSAEKAASPGLYLASDEWATRYSGEYFIKEKRVKPTKVATSTYNAKRLWEISEELCGMRILSEKGKLKSQWK
jgi:NAD(P)-dependent dehydrogenase (short-subunit alcohol dehydrogenase family)